MQEQCCDQFEEGIKDINRYIHNEFARSGVDGYLQKPFMYCPWCGTGLSDVPPLDTRRLIERELLERIVSAGFLDTSHDIGLQVACEKGSVDALEYIRGSGEDPPQRNHAKE